MRQRTGRGCTCIGYPTSSGTGNMIQPDSGYAISTTCKAPEAAWKFVRTFFTAEYQRNLEWSLPSNREVFNEKLTELMTPVYLQDENGCPNCGLTGTMKACYVTVEW